MGKIEEFISKARKMHGDRYDYSKSVYTNNKAKVEVICPIHGSFTVRASHHYDTKNPLGCKICANLASRLTTGEFIERAKKVHGDLYDYSNTTYTTSSNKVEIVCKEHGSFFILPAGHTSGKGCAKCAGIAKSSTEEFIAKAKKVYGNTYDYSLVNYTSNKNKVKIICSIHGVFQVRPNDHLMGKSGCPKCKVSKKLSQEEWVDKAVEKHKGYYSYNKVKYIDSTTKVSITCPKHGEFLQIPSNHLAGQGCSKCAKRGTDGDAIYIWRVVGYGNVYKVGITSSRLYNARVHQVATEAGLHPEIVIIAKVNDAHTLEKLLLSKGIPYEWDKAFNGSTEFRRLTKTELQDAVAVIKEYTSLEYKDKD